jgi:D-alanyl-lipoteichoic acid acyltransferase DltB (MBOAT superfamily)
MHIGTITGIGILLYFKYTNFFITSFATLFAKFNINLGMHTLSLILPLGISFYTFKLLSYLFDINKGKVAATADPVVFFSYVSFFPAILSGPIDKPNTLIPQLEKPRTFNYEQIADAMRIILWGLFKKVVIADSIAQVTNTAYGNYINFTGSAWIIVIFYFAIQLYADFSGYSDMAIGIAKLLGFNITKNFDFPFFAQNIAGFWRKWHMSLTTWLTDYVFTPLSISLRDYGKLGLILAILINFTIIGIWHGANWTFVLFGFLHGCFYIPLILKGTLNKKNKIDPNKLLPTFAEFRNMIFTFILVSFSFILFRAESIAQTFGILARVFSKSLLQYPSGISFVPIISSIALLSFEWIQRDKNHALKIEKSNCIVRWTVYILMFLSIIYFSYINQNSEAFMYVKF